MDWKNIMKYKDKSTNGTPIYDNGYYVISEGANGLEKIPTTGGFVVKINRISTNDTRGVWFNDKVQNKDEYSWRGCYDSYVVREATLKEIQKWEEWYK